MSKGKNQYVVRHENGWAVRGEGNERITKSFRTQAEAMVYVKDIAKNQKSDTKIQGRDGKFRAGNSYGNDPHPPKDKK